MNRATALALLDAVLDTTPTAAGDTYQAMECVGTASDRLEGTDPLTDELIVALRDADPREVASDDLDRLADLARRVALFVDQARTDLQDALHLLRRVDLHFEREDT